MSNTFYFNIVTKKPVVETCFAGVHGINREHVALRKENSSSACMDQRDNFINFQPSRVEFQFQYAFLVHPTHPKPDFIKEYKFGIGGGGVSICWKKTTKGIDKRQVR